MDEETVIKNSILRQKALEESGVKDPNVACAAVEIMYNIFHDYPAADLVTAWPFSDAFAYLVSAGLVTPDRNFTQKGLEVYRLENRKIYPIN